MKLKKEIIHSYNYCKKKAYESFAQKQFERSLNYIWIASQIANNFNWIYCDNELEDLLKDISVKLLKPTINYEITDASRIIFFDSFSWDNKGLTQQYIRAFISYDISFLYITESSISNKNSKTVFEELKAYGKAEIFEVPQNIERSKQIKTIYNKIISYKASKLFTHLSPSAVSAICAFYTLPRNITIYQINITDHAFWLGNKCLDYSLEFRPRGCTLSKEKRKLKEKQLLLQPYYPIVSESTFKGFPKELTKEKIIILSGGAFYKVFGENGEYFKLVKQILDDNKNVVLLFAGTGDRFLMDDFINKNGLRSKFILLGHRPDINEVFKLSDIYLATYPLGGGLMSLYAAMNGKPILSYKTNRGGDSVEELINPKKNMQITFTDKKLFFNEAERLISNTKYRNKRGREIRSALYSVEQFNESLLRTIKTNENQNSYDDVKIDYNMIFDQSIDNENTVTNYKFFIIKNLKTKTIILFPKIFIWFILFLFSKRGLNKMKNRLNIELQM